MKRKTVESTEPANAPKKLTLRGDACVPTKLSVDKGQAYGGKRKLADVDRREEQTLAVQEDWDLLRRKRSRSEDTILSIRKNRVEVVDAPKVSVPLYHAWKTPSAKLKVATNDEADSAFNSFNYWREALPPVQEECNTTNYGDFSWWRITPPDVLDLDVISDDSE